MPKRILIVEHDNDRHTLEAILRHMASMDKFKVASLPAEEVEWHSSTADPNPAKPTTLIKTLKSLVNDFKKGSYDRLGIVMDFDDRTTEERLQMINAAIEQAYEDCIFERVSGVNPFGKVVFQKGRPEEFEIRIACHFTGLSGKGEMEDLLKAIKAKPSPLADCVEAKLADCLRESGANELIPSCFQG